MNPNITHKLLNILDNLINNYNIAVEQFQSCKLEVPMKYFWKSKCESLEDEIKFLKYLTKEFKIYAN
jgi:hypothetical protein